MTLVGGWLRFQRLDLMEYKYDEAEMFHRASLHAEGRFQCAGMMSGVGVRNPPMAVWAFSLVRFFSADPVRMAWLPAGLGTLAIALCFWVTRRNFGLTAALAATALFATAPWAVMYSRKIWAQNLLPFFALSAMGCAFELLRGLRTRGNTARQTEPRMASPSCAVGFCVILAVMVQIHYSALALVPIGLVLMVWVRGKKAYLGWLVGILLGAATCVPFVIHEARVGFRDVRSVAGVGIPRDRRAGLTTLRHALELTSYHHFGYSLGKSSEGFRRKWRAAPGREIPHQSVPLVTAALFVAGFALALWRARRSGPAALLSLWIVLPPLAWSIAPPAAHYQIVMLPAPFVAMGLLAEEMVKPVRKRAAAAGVACATLVIALSHAAFFDTFLSFIGEHGGARGDYGMAYRYKLAAARRIAQVTAGGKAYTIGFPRELPVDTGTIARLARSTCGGTGRFVRGDESERAELLFIIMPADTPFPSPLPDGARLEQMGPFKLGIMPRASAGERS